MKEIQEEGPLTIESYSELMRVTAEETESLEERFAGLRAQQLVRSQRPK